MSNENNPTFAITVEKRLLSFSKLSRFNIFSDQSHENLGQCLNGACQLAQTDAKTGGRPMVIAETVK